MKDKKDKSPELEAAKRAVAREGQAQAQIQDGNGNIIPETAPKQQASPYDVLFRRIEERRDQRRREAEALRPQESAQEIEARHERLRKAAAISDAVTAIGNVLWTGRGSKQVYDPRQSMSEAARKRYAEALAAHGRQQQAWLRAREAYERGENAIENLRLRAMQYEDQRKAREAETARRERESARRMAQIDANMRFAAQKAADQHEKETHYLDYLDARTGAAHASAYSTRARAAAQLRNVNNQIKNRDSRTQQQNKESEDRIRKRKDNSGGKPKSGGVKRQTRTRL